MLTLINFKLAIAISSIGALSSFSPILLQYSFTSPFLTSTLKPQDLIIFKNKNKYKECKYFLSNYEKNSFLFACEKLSQPNKNGVLFYLWYFGDWYQVTKLQKNNLNQISITIEDKNERNETGYKLITINPQEKTNDLVSNKSITLNSCEIDDLLICFQNTSDLIQFQLKNF